MPLQEKCKSDPTRIQSIWSDSFGSGEIIVILVQIGSGIGKLFGSWTESRLPNLIQLKITQSVSQFFDLLLLTIRLSMTLFHLIDNKFTDNVSVIEYLNFVTDYKIHVSLTHFVICSTGCSNVHVRSKNRRRRTFYTWLERLICCSFLSDYYLRQEVMFSPLFVCLFVCRQDISKNVALNFKKVWP